MSGMDAVAAMAFRVLTTAHATRLDHSAVAHHYTVYSDLTRVEMQDRVSQCT
jgi:hypothetical protein